MTRSAHSQKAAWDTHFAVAHDPSGLASESNLFRYRPVPAVIVRVTAPRSDDLEIVSAAIVTTGGAPMVSVDPDLQDRITGDVVEDRDAFLARIASSPFAVIRYIGEPSDEERRAARQVHSHIADGPVLVNGRFELLHYLREQSVTRTRHRHGMLPPGSWRRSDGSVGP